MESLVAGQRIVEAPQHQVAIAVAEGEPKDRLGRHDLFLGDRRHGNHLAPRRVQGGISPEPLGKARWHAGGSTEGDEAAAVDQGWHGCLTEWR